MLEVAGEDMTAGLWALQAWSGRGWEPNSGPTLWSEGASNSRFRFFLTKFLSFVDCLGPAACVGFVKKPEFARSPIPEEDPGTRTTPPTTDDDDDDDDDTPELDFERSIWSRYVSICM